MVLKLYVDYIFHDILHDFLNELKKREDHFFGYLSSNDTFPVEYIMENLDFDWSWFAITQRSSITIEFIIANKYLPWDSNGLRFNPNISFTNSSYNYLGSKFGNHPNITIEFVLANPNLLWDWFELSKNPNITMEYVLANPNLPWNWFYLSTNPNITMDVINANPNLPWNWDALSTNTNITIDYCIANKHLPWNWDALSFNTNNTMQCVLANIDLPWNWKRLARWIDFKKINRVSHVAHH